MLANVVLGFVHRCHHANLDNFSPPLLIATFFRTKATVVTKS